MIGLTHDEMIALNPCAGNSRKVTQLLGGAKAWNGKKVTAAQAVAAGISFYDLVWVASAVARTDKDVEWRLRLWMADCAARVLHIYEKQVPNDPRARAAIVAARAFARGQIAAAARDAARDAAGDAAGAAARDAARDAAWAAWAAGAAAWAARDAAGDAAGDAAWAAAGAAAGAAGAAWAAEEKWQFDRLVLWLSDNEPEDLIC